MCLCRVMLFQMPACKASVLECNAIMQCCAKRSGRCLDAVCEVNEALDIGRNNNKKQ